MKKKFLSLALALVMLLSLAACGGDNNTPATDGNKNPDTPPVENNTPDTPAEPEGFQPVTYEDSVVYDAILGDYYKALLEAQAVLDDNDKMFALYAIAEAKLLESGVLFPYYSDGGSYGVTHIVPGSIPTVMWGSDSDRFENAILTNELLKVTDRQALKAMWNELAGTGTFEEEAKKYLSENGYTLNNEFVYAYSSDPEHWDTLAAWTNTVNEPVCLTVDSFAKYDMENTLQPALAESWEVSDDGLTWTFHLRPGLKWVDSQGREVADVKADDWVASLQHSCDNIADSAAPVPAPMIVNAYEYSLGEVADFSEVGVKAVDDLTVEYTLVQPVPTFESMLTYCGFFTPLCRSYYESQGGTFGADFDPTADSYLYGTDSDHIVYCGPYLVNSYTEQNSIVFVENPTYWDAGNLNVSKVTFRYYDGSDPLATYNDVMAGKLTSAGLGTSALQKCREDGQFEEYGNYTSALSGITRYGVVNVNRQIFHNFNDEKAAASSIEHGSVDTLDRENGVFVADASIVDAAAITHSAMNNLDFRMALARGWDQASYHAQVVGDELKYVSLRNTFSPGNFVKLDNDTTVQINGTDTTFPAGTYYGEIVQAQMTADGSTIKVWDPTLDEGAGSSDGFDGWYDMDEARAHMAKFVEAMAAQGVEISKENPVQIDYIYYTPSESMTNRANAYKQSIDLSLEGLVQVNLIGVETAADLNNADFYNKTGAESNGDVGIGKAWTADYGDPASFVTLFLPEGDGYMCKNLGLW